MSAGSGITPVMSMLRHLDRQDTLHDVVHLHSARDRDDVIFGDQLTELDDRRESYRLTVRFTGEQGRLSTDQLDELCPDWREREAFACGPGEMLDAFSEHWERHGDPERLHMERFQPVIGGEGGEGEGGSVKFLSSDVETDADGDTPILVAGEDAGATLPFGCRMGVCHTCVGKLSSGQVRDLRTGDVYGQEGEMIRTCVSAAEGPVEIEL